MNQKEIWKDVTGYEGFYVVSNFGNIKSIKRVVIHNEKSSIKQLRCIKNRILKGSIFKNGYRYVMLTKNKIRKYHLVHRLVATAFIDNPENKRTVNHKDADKLNNKQNNLEWCTQKENVNHAWDMGLCNPSIGVNNCNAKLNPQKVIQIRQMLKTGTYQKDIARVFKVDQAIISDIKLGKIWKHI